MIAGYISGRTVELSRVRRKDRGVELYDKAGFTCRDFSDFESILRLYIKRHPGLASRACLGVAGPVIRQAVTTTNLPWRIEAGAIADEFGLDQVHLINDIVATAYGLLRIGPDDFYTINEGRKTGNGNRALIAAGTGLGEALIYQDGDHYVPYASEGGHADFAPGNQLEAELWEFLYANQQPVEIEDILSFSGLEQIYSFFVEVHGIPTGDWFESAKDRASAIIEQALSGEDEGASRALDLFIECYASEAANLALKGMTIGGIFIGGRIAPQIVTAMDKGRFMERFVKRGKMEGLLADMPVAVIMNKSTALIGAAGQVLDM